MTSCPQCGSQEYEEDRPCAICGFEREPEKQPEYESVRKVPVQRRDLSNGVGIGCAAMTTLWFGVQLILYLVSQHGSSFWTRTGPVYAIGLPLAASIAAYFKFGQQRTPFSRGIGLSILITIGIFAVVMLFVVLFVHGKPPVKLPGDGNGY